jgi:hypothetical protein
MTSQETNSTTSLAKYQNLVVGERYWEGSKLRSTNLTFLNDEEISVQKFYASYLLRQEFFTETQQKLVESYLDGLTAIGVKLMPKNELLSEVPELQTICKLLRKTILMEAAIFQINYLLNTK